MDGEYKRNGGNSNYPNKFISLLDEGLLADISQLKSKNLYFNSVSTHREVTIVDHNVICLSQITETIYLLYDNSEVNHHTSRCESLMTTHGVLGDIESNKYLLECFDSLKNVLTQCFTEHKELECLVQEFAG